MRYNERRGIKKGKGQRNGKTDMLRGKMYAQENEISKPRSDAQIPGINSSVFQTTALCVRIIAGRLSVMRAQIKNSVL